MKEKYWWIGGGGLAVIGVGTGAYLLGQKQGQAQAQTTVRTVTETIQGVPVTRTVPSTVPITEAAVTVTRTVPITQAPVTVTRTISGTPITVTRTVPVTQPPVTITNTVDVTKTVPVTQPASTVTRTVDVTQTVAATPTPGIRSVAFLGTGQNMGMVITGYGFGSAPVSMPFVGNLPGQFYFASTGPGGNWSAGDGGTGVTLRYRSWANTQIVISGFAGMYGQNGWVAVPGNPFTIGGNNMSGSVTGKLPYPILPSGLTFSNITQTAFTLGWTPAQNATSYTVYHLTIKNHAITGSAVMRQGITGNSVTINGLYPAYIYQIAVQANTQPTLSEVAYVIMATPSAPGSWGVYANGLP